MPAFLRERKDVCEGKLDILAKKPYCLDGQRLGEGTGKKAIAP